MSTLSSDPKINIDLVRKLAIRAYPNNQVLADLTTAQAILESNLTGQPSQLAFKYNNLFGIKGSGTKGSVTLPTHEFVGGREITVNQAFAWNESVEDSIQQRKSLFENGTKDKHNRYFRVLAAPTFEDAAHELLKAGYATDPAYATALINIYNKYIKPLGN